MNETNDAPEGGDDMTPVPGIANEEVADPQAGDDAAEAPAEEGGAPPDDLSDDPAYDPDDEGLKDIKGG